MSVWLLPACLRLQVISSMADHVPLQDIVRRVLAEHGGAAFGDFRMTLLGLFRWAGALPCAVAALSQGQPWLPPPPSPRACHSTDPPPPASPRRLRSAYAYEHAIMGTANRLITKDAFGLVVESRARRARAQEAAGMLAASQAAEAGARAGREPPLAGQYVPSAVGSARQLGVLGRGGAGLVAGLGLVGGLQLQMSPDGVCPVGQFMVAAVSPQLQQGRHFYGCIDLAAEIAALHHATNLGTAASLQLPEGTTTGRQAPPGEAALAAADDSGKGQQGRGSFDIDELLEWTAAHS